MQFKTDAISKVMESDSISFKLIYVLSFTTCLMIALFTIALPRKWKLSLPGSESGHSFFDSVRVGVYSFMSYLF